MAKIVSDKNLKKQLFAAVVILISLVISVAALTFAWYTTNDNTKANVNKIEAANVPSESLGVSKIGETDVSSAIGLYAEGLTIAVPELLYPETGTRPLAVKRWYARSPIGLRPIDNMENNEFVTNETYNMHLFVADGVTHKTVSCTPTVTPQNETSEYDNALAACLRYAVFLEYTENDVVYNDLLFSSAFNELTDEQALTATLRDAKNYADIVPPVSQVRLFVWIDAKADSEYVSDVTQKATLGKVTLNLNFDFKAGNP